MVDAKGVLRLQKQYNSEMLYILTFQVVWLFLLNFLFCPGFLNFQAISGPAQIQLQSPGFPGFQITLGTLCMLAALIHVNCSLLNNHLSYELLHFQLV